MSTVDIGDLIRDKKYEEAEKLLIEIIEEMESSAMNTGEGIAPWFYEKLAGIYRKTKQNEKQINTIQRFLIQIKASGSRPKKIYDKYVKLMKATDENKLQRDIYNEYLSNLEKTNLKTTRGKCINCGNIGVYPVPKMELYFPEGNQVTYVPEFRTCCAFCCESILVSNR
jgi:hypothetical protein